MAECSHRCNGNCCRSFSIPYSPVELGRERARGKLRDIVKITDMLVYQGEHYQTPLGEQVGDVVNDKPGHWYTCKHFDDVSGSCSNYDERPEMCRGYPYGRRCDYTGCDYSGGGDELEASQEMSDLASNVVKTLQVALDKLRGE